MTKLIPHASISGYCDIGWIPTKSVHAGGKCAKQYYNDVLKVRKNNLKVAKKVLKKMKFQKIRYIL